MLIRPFRAWRPAPGKARDVAALPYDVMNTDEARQMAAGKPHSFLHVDRAEIDLPPETDIHADEVYAQARQRLDEMKASGILRQDDAPGLYIYRQRMGDQVQTGLVACTSVEEYRAEKIKKHEFTRPDKELDRVRHVDTCAAHTGPIFLIYKNRAAIRELIAAAVRTEADFDFVAEDGVGHTGWLVDKATAEQLVEQFSTVETLYIADGHHRAASAARVAGLRQAVNLQHTGEEEYNFFLAVLFADDELQILPYNRAVKDLNGLEPAEFLQKIGEVFKVEASPAGAPFAPGKSHEFGLFLVDKWYRLTLRAEQTPAAMSEALDVSILQDKLLTPVLNIGDPRTDQRIDFIGGIRGLAELERRVGTDMRLAFSLYPTQVRELMDIADAGGIMPPKSTWFEPKLRSGLYIHDL